MRQLENIIHRLVLMGAGETIGYDDLRHAISDSDVVDGKSVAPRAVVIAPHEGRSTQIEPLWLTEKRAIQVAIDACEGNINRAAGLLEVAPSTIYRKIQGWKSSGEN